MIKAASPNKRPQQQRKVPALPIEQIPSSTLPALQRMGFFIADETVNLPAHWRAKPISSKNRDTYLLKDLRGATHGVMTVSDTDPSQTCLTLAPRFNIEVTPEQKGNSYIVSLNDAGAKTHPLAHTDKLFSAGKPRRADVAAVANHIVTSSIGDLSNPLTRWNYGPKRVRRLVSQLRDVFGEQAGFSALQDEVEIMPATTPKAERAAQRTRLEKVKLRNGLEEIGEQAANDETSPSRDYGFFLPGQRLNW